ncbi:MULTISPECIES: phosphoribosylanthranilate isomerase [Sphingobacterium]|jgi:phosphoribosylanthranilate isomerase|uniref:N-(5'-phosphoribosyl)anthranilate isomerase n=1 Tax=Sphingobacterium anhuiense TaxID=493780 RepID=A0ABW5YS87_9SPHI|nr:MULTISPECIES: phosphoribosylanthranilate isomerase [unclassified Sphingobacterium]MCS3555546.1 phosphoribosylanthranilate isomerase [Sphingobacterium sp. JUb21]NJI76037.1 phosphoribosylanthranilate isomerase [Sphingobacterium sp. B16(2022)]QQD14547.1 phosphoribosylanthranilate isomerase [Sphingobacterium sp. UDSM-2020]TCR02302.1 phosphoribosylanthranilate isomerase [Sphingobacterium sp. JUb20]
MSLKIKVCGMKDLDNMLDLIKLPIDYMGLIFYEKSKRYVSALDAHFIKAIPGIKKIGVFVNASEQEILQKISDYGLAGIQLHGHEDPDFCLRLKSKDILVIKSFGIDENFDWQSLNAYESVADYFLFDTKTSNHGGSGIHFDWDLLRNYPLEKPYFLSGGLSAENIREASQISDPRLYGLDLNSKFEFKSGIKNVELLEQTLKNMNYEQVPG